MQTGSFGGVLGAISVNLRQVHARTNYHNVVRNWHNQMEQKAEKMRKNDKSGESAQDKEEARKQKRRCVACVNTYVRTRM